MTVLSTAMQEAYASVDTSGDTYPTVEIGHVSFEAPLFFLAGVPKEEVFETMDLPVDGVMRTHKVVDFGFTLPGHEEGGPTKARVRIDNVSSQISQALRAAIASDQPFTFTYRAFNTNDLDHPEVYSGLIMKSVDVDAFSASGELTFEEVDLKAYPRQTYDLETYPALYGQ